MHATWFCQWRERRTLPRRQGLTVRCLLVRPPGSTCCVRKRSGVSNRGTGPPRWSPLADGTGRRVGTNGWAVSGSRGPTRPAMVIALLLLTSALVVVGHFVTDAEKVVGGTPLRMKTGAQYSQQRVPDVTTLNSSTVAVQTSRIADAAGGSAIATTEMSPTATGGDAAVHVVRTCVSMHDRELKLGVQLTNTTSNAMVVDTVRAQQPMMLMREVSVRRGDCSSEGRAWGALELRRGETSWVTSNLQLTGTGSCLVGLAYVLEIVVTEPKYTKMLVKPFGDGLSGALFSAQCTG